MFEFTTQTIYNSITVKTDAQVKAGAKANVITSTGGKTPAIRIGNTRFNANDIASISVKNPTDEYFAEVEFDLSKVLIDEESDVKETTGRIALYLGLSMSSQDSLYANDLVYKGKPLFIEFPIKKDDTADVLAQNVKKIADKYMLFMFQDKILNVEVTSSAAVPGQGGAEGTPAQGKVKFVGVNGYQQIKKAVLQVYDTNVKPLDCCTNLEGFVDKIVGVPVIYTIDDGVLSTENKVFDGVTEGGRDLAENEVAILPGIEAFGDYNWIIHNLRLPTLANTHFWSPTVQAGEMPVVGGKYTQFTIEMRVDNVGIAGEAVGQRHTSTTKHVLYVAGECACTSGTTTTDADKVYSALYTVLGGDTKIDKNVDNDFNDPYHTA